MNEKNLATMICSVCGEEKRLREFPKKYTLYKDIKPICRTCSEEKVKEKLKITSRNRYKKHKESDPYIMWARGTINNHKKKGFQVDMSVKELAESARHTPHCNLCGCTLVWNGNIVTSLSATLDRINNEDVMSKDNTQILCHRCNRMKGSMSVEEFIYYCSNIVKRNKGVIKDTSIFEMMLKERDRMMSRRKEYDNAIKRLHKEIESVVKIKKEELKKQLVS